MNKHILLVMILICLGINHSFGQSIKLLDTHTNSPIINASYKYNQQQGISNDEGIISISQEANAVLSLSHLKYGVLILEGDELNNCIKSGYIYWKRQQYELQPVSIIALHQFKPDSSTIYFNNQNRLSHDASAILAQMPEIALIRKSGSYGFDPVLRGFKYEQLNIVLDGAQSANAACPNRMDPPSSQMPVNMLSQIIILKGPYSLRYGNSFGGTINFQSEPPEFGTENRLSGRISGNYESNGNIYRSEGLVGFKGELYNIKLYGSHSSGGHYSDGDGNTVHSSFNRNNIGMATAFKINDHQNMRINLSHNYAKNIDFPALPMDLRKDDTWLGSINHSVRFNKKLQEWNTSVYSTYVDHLMDNYGKELDPRMTDAETAAKTYNYGGRTEGYWLFGQNQLFAGMDYRGDKAEGERTRHFLMGPNKGKTIYDNVWQDASVDKIGAFAEFQSNYRQWQLIYSGRLELNQADTGKPDPNFETYYDDLSSSTLNLALSFGMRRHLSPKIIAELWLGHAERSGSLTERYINFLPVGVDPYEMLGNPELSSEKNNQFDINLKYKGRSTKLHLSLFAAFMNDYISSEIREDIDPKMPSSPGVRQFINIEQAQLMGFETVWMQQLPASLNHRLSIAYTHGKNADTGEALPEIPPLDMRYTLSGNYLKNNLKPQISFRHVLKQERIAESFGETTTPAFSLVDVRINYALSSHFELNAAVTNLFNEHYYEHLTRSVKGSHNAIYAPGRSFIFTVVAKL